MCAPVLMESGLPAIGEELLVEIDVADEGSEELVWAAATVSSVDLDKGEFWVMVTEFENLPPDNEDFEEAYSEGPYVTAQLGQYVDGYEGRWRRIPTVPSATPAVATSEVKPTSVRVTTRRAGVAIKTNVKVVEPQVAEPKVAAAARRSSNLPAIGEELLVEIDVADEGSEELVWAAATVSSVDLDKGEFWVMVTEFENLPPDNEDFEEAYSEGPYVTAQLGQYVDGYEGRWRRAPRVPEESGWQQWLEKPNAGVDGWWRQDDKVVSLAIQLPDGSVFKRDVQFKLAGESLSLTVMRDGSDEVASLSGPLSHRIDAEQSDWFVEDTVNGFEGFGPDSKFLVVALQKATRGVTWSSVVLKDGERPEAKVTVKRTDGVTVRRPDAPGSTPATSKPSGKKTVAEWLDMKGTNVTAAESASKGVGVTIRRKKK